MFKIITIYILLSSVYQAFGLIHSTPWSVYYDVVTSMTFAVVCIWFGYNTKEHKVTILSIFFIYQSMVSLSHLGLDNDSYIEAMGDAGVYHIIWIAIILFSIIFYRLWKQKGI